MTLFIVDITKEFTPNGQRWGNRYIVSATDIEDAHGAAPLIVDQEKRFHSTDVAFIQYRVATVTANDGIYITVLLSVAGETGPPSSPVVPIQTCVRVDIARVGHGR